LIIFFDGSAEEIQTSRILTNVSTEPTSFLASVQHVGVETISSICSFLAVHERILTISTKLASGRAFEVGDRVDNTLSVSQEVSATDRAGFIHTSADSTRVSAVNHCGVVGGTLSFLVGLDTSSLLPGVLAGADPTGEWTKISKPCVMAKPCVS
jgi:hypothetical protein